MFVYILMGYALSLIALGVISGESALVYFGLLLLLFANLHNLAKLLRRRRAKVDDELRVS